MKKIKIVRPLSMALAGEPKTGKSTIGAMIIKKYGGLFLDLGRVNQSGGMDGSTVKYSVDLQHSYEKNGEIIKEVGESWTAVSKNGIEDQYRLILNWKDFENVIAEANVLSEDVLQKKIWLVIDDTVAWRKHKVLDVKDKLGHKSATKNDWGIATQELNLLTSKLSKTFNLFLICQMSDEYQTFDSSDENGKSKSKEKSGIRAPLWIPSGLDYLVDGMIHIEIDKTVRPYKQYLVIDGGREVWVCDENFSPKVDKITPELIMKVMGISEDRL